MIYSTGYSGEIPENLPVLAAKFLNALVVDIRYNPDSRNPCWKQASLKRLLGDSYFHIKALGNVNYKSGKREDAKILNMEVGLAAIQSLVNFRPDCAAPRRNAIFLCVCPSPAREKDFCHVQLIELRLLEEGIPIIYIPDWKSKITRL